VKKVVCTKLLFVFLLNLFVMPFAHGGGKKFRQKNSGNGKRRRRDKRSVKNKKFVHRKRKKEKRRKSKERERVERLKINSEEKKKYLENSFTKKRICFGECRKRNKKYSSDKLRFSGRMPLWFLPAIILLFFATRASCFSDDAEFYYCEPGKYLFELTNVYGVPYEAYLDCKCTLYEHPIWGAVFEVLDCSPFPQIYTEGDCSPGEYLVEVKAINVKDYTNCDCSDDNMYLGCNHIFSFSYSVGDSRRSITSNGSQNISESNQIVLDFNRPRQTSYSSVLIMPTGLVCAALGALCCLPCVCKKQIKKLRKKFYKKSNKQIKYETEIVSDSQSSTETETETEDDLSSSETYWTSEQSNTSIEESQ